MKLLFWFYFFDVLKLLFNWNLFYNSYLVPKFHLSHSHETITHGHAFLFVLSNVNGQAPYQILVGLQPQSTFLKANLSGVKRRINLSRYHIVEQREDFKRITALGSHQPDQFPAVEDRKRGIRVRWVGLWGLSLSPQPHVTIFKCHKIFLPPPSSLTIHQLTCSFLLFFVTLWWSFSKILKMHYVKL